MTINELKIYFESEYNSTKMFLADIPSWVNEKDVINNTLQRMLGAAMLSQHCDLPYREVVKLYEIYQYKIKTIEGVKNV